jgi:arylformamidase
MQIHDISLPVSESLIVWPGDRPVEITRSSDLAQGDTATVSHISMSVHSGTHVDAPAHFVPDGAGVEALDLSVLVGQAAVIDAQTVDVLSASTLDEMAIPAGAARLLFRTRNSNLWARGEPAFRRDYVAISPDGAQWLTARGVKLVGVDYLSVAAFNEEVDTHRLLLSAGVIVVESLNLSGIEPGTYTLVCLPLRLTGLDGAPARAILLDQNEER